MRGELTAAVRSLFAGLSLRPVGLNDSERDRLIALASFAARCRSAVERDGYRCEIELIPDRKRPAGWRWRCRGCGLGWRRWG